MQSDSHPVSSYSIAQEHLQNVLEEMVSHDILDSIDFYKILIKQDQEYDALQYITRDIARIINEKFSENLPLYTARVNFPKLTILDTPFHTHTLDPGRITVEQTEYNPSQERAVVFISSVKSTNDNAFIKTFYVVVYTQYLGKVLRLGFFVHLEETL